MMIALALAVLVGAAPAPSPTIDPKIETRAKEWLHRAQTGTIDRSQLNAQSKAALTPTLIKETATSFGALGAPTAFTFVNSHIDIGHVTHTKYTTYSFLVTFANEKDVWDFTLDAHGKIAGLFLNPYVEHMHLSEDHVISDLTSKLQTVSANGAFSGAVLVAKDGKPVFEQAYGLADREKNLANTTTTRFRLGSMNKMFTAVSIMQLVQAGKIDLNAPLGTYIRDYPNADVAKVTIHQLLTHTGGTGDFFGPEYDKHRLELRTLDDYVKLFGKRGTAFKPGSRWAYSNYGFMLLGVVIERVSGESYYDYVREHVFTPAGMMSTDSVPEDQPVADRSVGYTMDRGKLHPNNDSLPYRGTSAGGGYSTVDDLLKFANALQSNTLLDAAHVQLLTTGKVDMPSMPDNPRRYAYGFGDERINGIRCFGHDGGAPGMNGALDICPGPGYTVIVLANQDPPAADNILSFVVNRLPLK